MKDQTIRETAAALVVAMKDLYHVKDELETATSELAKLEAVAIAEGLPGSNAEQRKANLAAMYPVLRENVARYERLHNNVKLLLDIAQINWEAVKWEIRNGQLVTSAQLAEVLATLEEN